MLVSKKCSTYKLNRDQWTTYIHFILTHEHIMEEMVEVGIAEELPEKSWMEKVGEVFAEHKAFGCIEAPARSPCRRCGASRHGSMLLATEAYKFIQKTYQFAHLRKTVRSPYYGLDGAERCAACQPGALVSRRFHRSCS